jgi:hypothetical protein
VTVPMMPVHSVGSSGLQVLLLVCSAGFTTRSEFVMNLTKVKTSDSKGNDQIEEGEG